MSQILSVLVFLSFCTSQILGEEYCDRHEKSKSYLDAAVDLIAKARRSFPEDPTAIREKPCPPIDCAEVLRNGHNHSGVYTIWPRSRVTDGKPLGVYCDMDTDGGGWIVIQRRGNFNRSKDYFFKDWASYKNGFGDIEKDFWLGNDNIFALTNQRVYSIRFDLKAVGGETGYAFYDLFWIDDESQKYMLHIQDYSGNAGDSMIAAHNTQKFSSSDQDNDSYKTENCSQKFKGGWWYGACYHSNLNGLYHRGPHESAADGVNWHTFKGHTSLDTTEMKIRPKNVRR